MQSEKYPYSRVVEGFPAFEGPTNTSAIPEKEVPDLDPSLLKVLEDIWGRHELSCLPVPIEVIDGIVVSPDNWLALLRLVYNKPTLLSELTTKIHRLILNLAGKIYDMGWLIYDKDRMISSGVRDGGAIFPDDYQSIPTILSPMSFSQKTSLTVRDSFRIAGIIRRNEQYASWSVNNGPPDKPFLFHKLIGESVKSKIGGVIRLSSLNNSGGNTLVRQEVIAWMPPSWDGVQQSVNPTRKYWIACDPIKILDQEQGNSFGKRVVEFNLVKDKEFGYFASRTRSGRDIQYYMSTSDGDSTAPYEEPRPVVVSSSSSEVISPTGELMRDEPNRYIVAPTARQLYKPNEPGDPQPAPWQIVGYVDPDWKMSDTGEVPYRRPHYTAFTLNGHQIPVLDRMTDITHLLVNGTNILEVEYLGRYGWSDWWILPAITIAESYNFRSKPWGPRRPRTAGPETDQ